MSDWQPIDSAPYGLILRIKVKGRKRSFRARLEPLASMTENEQAVDQWQAVGDDYPKCWSDGKCWESNADDLMSKQPTHWRLS